MSSNGFEKAQMAASRAMDADCAGGGGGSLYGTTGRAKFTLLHHQPSVAPAVGRPTSEWTPSRCGCPAPTTPGTPPCPTHRRGPMPAPAHKKPARRNAFLADSESPNIEFFFFFFRLRRSPSLTVTPLPGTAAVGPSGDWAGPTRNCGTGKPPTKLIVGPCLCKGLGPAAARAAAPAASLPAARARVSFRLGLVQIQDCAKKVCS